MATSAIPDSALAHRANLNIAAAVVAKFGASVPDSLIGGAIDTVRASHSVAELANADNMPMVVSAVETFVARQLEADRPRNLYGAEAARAAQVGETGLRGFGAIDPIRPGSSARFRELGNGDGTRSDSGRAAISGTGSEPAGAAFWGTEQGRSLTHAYASANGMDWAPPDLMKMGRPALEALKDSGLKADSYKTLRDPNGLNLSNTAIISGAGYMKRSHLNYHEAAKAGAAVYAHPSMTREDKDDWRTSLDRSKHPEGATGDEGYRQGIRRSGTKLKEKHPEMTPEVNEAMKKYGADRDARLETKAKSEKVGATAENKDAKADAKTEQVKPAQKRQDATKSKLLAMYN